MAEYTQPQVDAADTDPSSIAQNIYVRMQDAFPGWESQDSTPETVAIEAFSTEIAETRRIARDDGFNAFAVQLAQTVFGEAPTVAVSATATSTWTMADTSGHLIPAGTQVTLPTADGTRIGFLVVSDVTIPAGVASTSTGAVTLAAIDAGVDGNGLFAGAQPEETLSGQPTIVLDAPTSGGADGETTAAFLNRFARIARRFSPRLITPDDFEEFARDWPGVARAIALDTYDPVAGTYGNAGVVTVVPIDSAGSALSSPTRAALQTAMEAETITGMVVNVTTPTYTTIAVQFTATSYPGFDPAVVETAAIATVQTFLSPAQWGLAPFGEEAVWLDEPVVTRGDLFAVLERVDGLRHVTTLIVNGSSVADAPLPGTPGLPSPASTVLGSVTGS